jgi:S-adenosylmethionine synthetase
MSETQHETAEFVLPGHPDKLCDAVVDSIVDAVRRADPEGQCGLEAACVFDRLFITGRIAARRDVLDALDVDALARQAWASAGYGVDAAGHAWGPLPEAIRIETVFCRGEFEPGERELRHLSDDQAICVGYANRLGETDHLPPAHWLARRIGRELSRLRREKGAGHVGPDAKVIVRVGGAGWAWQPRHVSISLNHHEASDWILLREVAEEAVEAACAGRRLPDLELNGAGMFVSGGPNGDNGLSGKKLVVDAYGPTVPIGGGAWSGKDFRKVDRIGGLLARELALSAVGESGANEARVTLEYIPGCSAPVHVGVQLDNRPIALAALPATGAIARDNLVAWQRYVTVEPPLVELARWGHQQPGAPWEARPADVANGRAHEESVHATTGS